MLDLLFPNLCPSCRSQISEGAALCGTCLNDIDFIENHSVCALCGDPLGYFNSRMSAGKAGAQEPRDSHLCANCLKGRYSFDRARSIAFYDGPVREIIHALKYEGKLHLGEVLSDILIKHFPADLGGFDLIVPVPLYISKLRNRLYNQSAILASRLARSAGITADVRGLRKTRDTKPQFEIKDEARRRRNVRGAFGVRDNHPFARKSVLLVDDVFTTGSTSDECAKTLIKSGALRVQVLTLTRAKGM